MDPRQFQGKIAHMDEIARAISDLLPETALFSDEDDPLTQQITLDCKWRVHAMSGKAMRWHVRIPFSHAQYQRYVAAPMLNRARGQALIHAHFDALLQSLEQRFAQQEALGDTFEMEVPVDFI
jgi:hypothetical protein